MVMTLLPTLIYLKAKHRLTKPATPKTNGMVERVNGTIKNATVKATTYQNIDGMKRDLNQFLIFYNFNRGPL
jgi:transposase InsO family protein